MHLHDMWSALGTEISWPSRKQQPGREQPRRRVHNHHISWRDRIRAFQHDLQKQEVVVVRDPTKAVAWAVFLHHGHHSHHSPGSSSMTRRRRRPTRFKLEAQMKHEMAHRSLVQPEGDIRRCWDAGSTLFDSFELDSLLKTLNQAAADEIDGAVVVEAHDLHKHGHHHHHHHHGTWRSLLHSLHLDHGLHWKWNHSQVSPHYNYCAMEHKGRKEDGHMIDVAQFDAQFDRNEVHVSKDVHDPSSGEEDVHHRHQLWKLLTHSFHGHKRHS